LAATGQLALGVYLFFTGINYIPLLVYAKLVRAGSANTEVGGGSSQDRHHVRKYSAQQLLIFVPFAVILPAAAQELTKRSHPAEA
jgi:hypothetical protein